MNKRVYLAEDGSLVRIVEDVLGDIALLVNITDYTLLDWDTDVEVTRRYNAAKRRAYKTAQASSGPYPSLLLIPLFAAHLTPKARCYAIQRATSGHASEFIAGLARHYTDNTYIDWLKAEMARSPLTTGREVLCFMTFHWVPFSVRHRAPRSQFWGALLLYH